MDSVRILYVATHIPIPAVTGVRQRVLNIARQLKKCGKVTFVYVGRKPVDELPAQMEQEFDDVVIMPLKGFDRTSRLGILRMKFDMHWPGSCGPQMSPKDKQTFAKLLDQHDIVWFHTLAAANCFAGLKFPVSVMDMDDLLHIKFDLRRKIDKTLRLKLSAWVQSFKWKKKEFASIKKFSEVLLCSKDDSNLLGDHDNIHVVPNGCVSPSGSTVNRRVVPFRLGFIGTLGYPPNAEGLRWFRQSIWPVITRQYPKAHLRIVGKAPASANFIDADGFEPLGVIEEPADEIATWSAMIVPLQIGGGTRLKIIEAFSRKCPVVSTTIGAYGLGVTHDENILLADNAETFAQQCARLFDNKALAKQLTNAGWEVFNKKYTWDVIGQAVKEVVDDCLARRE